METLPLPKLLTQSTGRGHQAVFVIEPLYPGYGTTLGNALRRVLLSSLPGAAITHVKIEGVTHEFSSLPYVKEDVVDILLNLKLIRFKLHSDEPVTVQLNAKGAKVVSAGDITTTSDIEVFNPNQTIATLTDAAGSISMELTVAKGRGYVPVENREKENLDIGSIAIDAIYTPIKNVNFTTEHVRVEQITNFDKLILEIGTDGTISPQEALQQAATIMDDHFHFVLANLGDSAQASSETAAESSADEEASGQEKPKRKTKKKKDEETPVEEPSE